MKTISAIAACLAALWSLVPGPQAAPLDAIGSASISGRVTTTGPQPQRGFTLVLIPATEPQPISGTTGGLNTDTEGNFTAQDLGAGDYLLGLHLSQLGEGAVIVTSMPETIQHQSGGVVTNIPAMRVSVAAGEMVTGVEITITLPTPGRSGGDPTQTPAPLPSTPSPVQTRSAAQLPPTGGGQNGGSSTSASLAVLLFAGWVVVFSAALMVSRRVRSSTRKSNGGSA